MSIKRKAALAAVNVAMIEVDAPPVKRRKTLPSADDESPENTTRTGFDLLNQLNKSRDKQGWNIATHFKTLPSMIDLPEYYKEIGLPIALDTIEAKLQRREYPNITTLESDVKRLVSNAKSFNPKTSQIYSDAEKVRKLVSNFMTERNPAYRDPNYQAVATPIPQGWDYKPLKKTSPGEQQVKPDVNGEIKSEETTSESRSGRRSGRSVAPVPAVEEIVRRASSTPAVADAEDVEESFEGKSFQQAQDKIVTEMINLTDEDDQRVSLNFIHLPSRQLADYYRIIKHPVSLKSLQKQVRGLKGQGQPAQAVAPTLFRSWNAFEQEVSYVWNNAREYNEDSSDIVKLALILKAYFYRRLEEAKATVIEPPQPRVKLTIGGKSPDPPPRITLKFGVPKPSGSAGVSIDNTALKRQQDLVKGGINDQASGHASRPALSKFGNGMDNGIIMNGVKRETSHARSPALGASQMNGGPSPSMAPPAHIAPRIPSGSPHPQSTGVNGATSAGFYPSSTYSSYLRQSGKDSSEALIQNLNISTHPDSKLLQRFNLDIPASDTRTQQSVTISLPSTHLHVRIAPTLSSSLMQRPSKTFVTCNNRRQGALAQRDLDQVRPLYETMLSPGINTIELEVIAGLPRGAQRSGTGSDIEIEKMTLFIHVQRA